MADSTVEVQITADPSGLETGLDQASAAANETFAQIRQAGEQASQGMTESFAAGSQKMDAGQKKLAASWMAAFRPINQAFDRSVAGMIMGTTTWQKAVSRIGQSIIAEELNAALKVAENWAISEVIKTQATETGAAARTAAEQSAGATSLLGLAANAVKAITTDAAQTFGGVFAFLSPEMGPAAAGPAAAAESAVMAVAGSVVSAEGGMWQVPGTVLSMLHPKESVIPASVANPMRDFFSGGAGTGSQGASGVVFAPQINALDARSVVALFNTPSIMRSFAKNLGAYMAINPSARGSY